MQQKRICVWPNPLLNTLFTGAAIRFECAAGVCGDYCSVPCDRFPHPLSGQSWWEFWLRTVMDWEPLFTASVFSAVQRFWLCWKNAYTLVHICELGMSDVRMCVYVYMHVCACVHACVRSNVLRDGRVVEKGEWVRGCYILWLLLGLEFGERGGIGTVCVFLYLRILSMPFPKTGPEARVWEKYSAQFLSVL